MVSLKATLALFLAPALAAVLPTRPADDLTPPPDAFVTLDFTQLSEQLPLQGTTLELRILESISPCDHGSLTINDEPLAQNELGSGSGSITTSSGDALSARWKFTCIRQENGEEAQLLSFAAVSLNGQEVHDTAFSISFQQTAPVSIISIEEATYTIKRIDRTTLTESTSPSLEVALAELKALEEQLHTLEHTIASKIKYITETFDARPETTFRRIGSCDTFKCVMQTIYSRVKGMASHVYHVTEHQEVTDWSASSHGWTHTNHGHPHSNHSSIDAQESNDNRPQQLSTSGDESEYPLASSGQPYIQRPHYQDNKSGSPHHGGALIIAIIILSNLVTFSLIFLFVRRRRQQRKARWEQRRRQIREARGHCTTSATMAAVDLIKWLRDGMVPHEKGDEEKDAEKEAVMSRFGSDSEPDSEPDSDLESTQGYTPSTTMEEELAQLRAVAGAVGDMVASNGRGRVHMQDRATRPRRSSVRSIVSSCPSYTSTDLTLPPYSPSYVPGSSQNSQAPSETATSRSSLDDDSERKAMAYYIRAFGYSLSLHLE